MEMQVEQFRVILKPKEDRLHTIRRLNLSHRAAARPTLQPEPQPHVPPDVTDFAPPLVKQAILIAQELVEIGYNPQQVHYYISSARRHEQRVEPMIEILNANGVFPTSSRETDTVSLDEPRPSTSTASCPRRLISPDRIEIG